MLRFYSVRYKTYHNDTFMGDTRGTILTDEPPINEKIELTWDNLTEYYKKKGLCVPFSVWHYNKGRLVSFFNGSIFNKDARDIKEWKSPLNITLTIDYCELNNMSIKEVLAWHDGDKAIQYLVERGLSLMDIGGH